MVVKVNSSILYQSEKFVNTLDHVPVDEIHLIDVKKHEIHMKTKDLLYGEIFQYLFLFVFILFPYFLFIFFSFFLKKRYSISISIQPS